jgi:TolA-binding protein
LLYAAALERAGRYADALAVADKLLEHATVKDSDDAKPAEASSANNVHGEALATRAQALAGLQRWEDAIASFSQYLDEHPAGPRAAFCWGERAVCLARHGRWDETKQNYDSYLKIASSDRSAANSVTERLAVLAAGTDHDAWSSELFARLADKQNPSDVAARGLWGQACNAYRASRWQEASQLFAEFLTRFESHTNAAEALLLRGTALEKLKDHDGAAAVFTELAERFPTSGQASSGLLAAARLATRKQQKEEAAALYKRLVDEHIDDPHADVALFEWSWVLRDLGRADEADDRLATLRERFPTSAYADDATYRLAERAYRAGDYARAEELTTVLLAERPADGVAPQLAEKLAPYAWYLAGQVAAAQEHWPAVAERMQRVRALKPTGTLALLADFWGAEALYRQNDFAAAAQRFGELAPRIEGRRENWAAVAALRRAQSQAQLKNWDAAESLARRIPVDFPQFNQQHEVDYLLGRSLASRGLFQQAREAYRRVIDSTTGGKTETVAMAQWMTGETHFHQQDYAAAIREYLRGETLYAFPEWQAASLLQAAKCHEALAQWEEAIKLYEQLGQKYSTTTHASEAGQRLTAARAQLSKRQATRPAKPTTGETR